MSVTTILLIKMNRYIRIFRAAGATNPSNAIIPAAHGIRNSLIFKRLIRKGVLVAASDNKYYLNQEKEVFYRKHRQKIVVVLLVLILLGIMLGILTV